MPVDGGFSVIMTVTAFFFQRMSIEVFVLPSGWGTVLVLHGTAAQPIPETRPLVLLQTASYDTRLLDIARRLIWNVHRFDSSAGFDCVLPSPNDKARASEQDTSIF